MGAALRHDLICERYISRDIYGLAESFRDGRDIGGAWICAFGRHTSFIRLKKKVPDQQRASSIHRRDLKIAQVFAHFSNL